LAGFLAVAVIADTVELDVRRSSDGKLVLAHDPTLGDHIVSQTPWEVLVEVDLGGGHHPTLLDEVMAALPDTPIQLEIKNIPHQPGFEPDHRVGLEAAERTRPGDIVTSFNPATLEAVRRVFPDVPTGLAVEPFVDLDEAVQQCLDAGYAALVPRETMITAPLQAWDELAVFPWTVNDPDRAIELVEFGVSGIITDDAATIRGVLEERQ
jgi:glycerophosphoryl diester phosphodiesterase